MQTDTTTRYQYLVLETYPSEPIWSERRVSETTPESVVADILSGDIRRPHRVVALSLGTGQVFDASAIIARTVASLAFHAQRWISRETFNFIEEHAGFEYSRDLLVIGEDEREVA